MNELAEPFPITLQAISKHLKVLERAGLIVRGRSAQLRPSRLQGEALKEVADWVADYRGFWEERFDRLDEICARTDGGAGDHDHARLRRSARAGVAGVDRARAARPLVGQARLEHAASSITLDVRPGGVFRLYSISDEDGPEMLSTPSTARWSSRSGWCSARPRSRSPTSATAAPR